MTFFRNNAKYFFLFCLYMIWFSFIYPLNINIDEIWSYGFSLNLFNCEIPYLDFNMIVTPLYPLISSLPFYIFGKNIIFFHIGQAFLFCFGSYFLFKILDKKAWIIIIFIFFPVSLFFPGYNILCLYFLFLIIYLEKNNGNDFLIGFIVGLMILTKQSFGLPFLLPLLIYIKDIRKIINRLLGSFIPCFIFLVYLLLTKSLFKFINLCILGLFDFAGSNGRGFNIYFFLFLILFFITIYIIFKNKKDRVPIYILMSYSLVIPLFDIIHFHYILIPFLVLILIYNIKFNINWFLIFSFSICVFGYNIYITEHSKFIAYPNVINNFNYRYIDYRIPLEVENKIKNKYNDYDFYSMDVNSYFFKIMFNKNTNYLDMINKGNWGYNGHKKFISMINKCRNKKVLFLIDKRLLNGFNSDDQCDREAIKYIINNGKKIDHVYIYDIYILNDN